MGYPNLGPPGSLNVDSAYSGSLVDPGAYSGSFYTQELPEDEESRDLSGSGPFRHMSYQTYGGGEMSCTLYSTEAGVGGRSGLLPRAGDDISPSPHQRGPPRNSSGRLAGFSAPIPESTLYGEPDEHHSLSASLSPHSGSIDVVPGHTPTPPPAAALRRPGQTECLADALGHLSIPSDPSATPAPGASSVAAAAAYRRAMRASAAAMAPPHVQPPGGNHMGHASWQAAPYAAAPPAPRADVRGLPSAGECIPLTVSQWSQDHTSVTIFLELEKFNPASLMVQIQQHMVVVMALNTDSPSHVFMMRPEHAVRVQGSKSRPQPGNGIHIVLQVRCRFSVCVAAAVSRVMRVYVFAQELMQSEILTGQRWTLRTSATADHFVNQNVDQGYPCVSQVELFAAVEVNLIWCTECQVITALTSS